MVSSKTLHRDGPIAGHKVTLRGGLRPLRSPRHLLRCPWPALVGSVASV